MNKAMVVTVVILVLVGGAALLVHLHHRREPSGPVYHVRTEFEFTVQAPYKIVAPLFGADGERAWGGSHWDPRFIYPQPARDIEGAVFRVSHGHHHATWINTAFDLEHGHVQYVYMIPEAMVTLIDIHLAQPSASSTSVHVAYERTALNASANEHVREFGEADRNNGKEWGNDIERYLATQRHE